MLLKSSYSTVVSAIVYSIIRDRFEAGVHYRGFPHNEVARFLLGQHGRMVDYLRWPMLAVTLAFDWSSLPLHGRRFHRMAPAERSRRIEAWRASRLSPCRDFVQFYESLVVFHVYSMGEARAPIEASAGVARAAR